jgi:hypothetical protein
VGRQSFAAHAPTIAQSSGHSGGIAHLRGQRRPGLVAHEQGAAELLFEQVDPGAYRGLADIQPLSRADEISAADDFKECSYDLGVHEQH